MLDYFKYIRTTRVCPCVKPGIRCFIAGLLLAQVPLGADALAQVSAGGLGTRVNGSVFGRCSVGSCAVHGGTGAGETLFHRLGALDTRSGIREVRIDTAHYSNLFLAVSNPAGSFLNVPLSLSDPANLILLSPGGLWVGQGSRLNRVPNLLLSTGVGLVTQAGRIDALTVGRSQLLNGAAPEIRFRSLLARADQPLVIGAESASPLVINRALLSLDGGLIVDAATGPLAIREAHLQTGNALRLSGQQFSLFDSSLRVGEAGQRGPINLLAYMNAHDESFGSGLMERVRISGSQITVSSGSLRLLDSHILAPKGWVELRTTNPLGMPADLELVNTYIDLNPALMADAWGPQILRGVNRETGVREAFINPIPHISLRSRDGLKIERSSLDASLLLPRGAEPTDEAILGALPEKAGLIFAEAAGNISLHASTIRADASNNLAGIVAMEAGKDQKDVLSKGELLIRDSRLSTSHGAGGGVMILQADNGLSVFKSSLTATTDRQLLVPGLNLPNGLRPALLGGKVNLFNRSQGEPLLISSSTIVANQHTAGGVFRSPLLSLTLNVDGFGTLGGSTAWTPGLHPVLSGGYLQLYSKGGLRVEAGSRLDVSSRDPVSGKYDTLSGTVALLNSGNSTIEFDASSIDGRNASSPGSMDSDLKAGVVYLYGDGAIHLQNARIDLGAAQPKGLQNILASPYFGIGAGGRLRVDGNSELISQSNIYDGFAIYDGLIAQNLPIEDPLIKGQVLARMFAGGSRYVGGVSIVPPTKSVRESFEGFRDELNRYRVTFEKILRGLPDDGADFSLPPEQPPSLFAPQALPQSSRASVSPLSLAMVNQPDAGLNFLEGQQQALVDTIAALGLAPGSGRVRSVAELQRRLLRIQQLASPHPDAINTSAASLQSRNTYRPAILQFGLAELPSDQVQMNTVLLLPSGQPLSFTQTLSATRLKAVVRGFQRQLSRQEPVDFTAGPGAELARWLIEPLAGALRTSGANALLLAADRGLQAIPYGALPFGDQPLAERYALSVSPSLGLLDLDGEPSTSDGLLLAAGASRFQQALAPLPMVPKELAALASEQGATLLLDDAFTVDALQRQAQQERIGRLHIATHAEFEPGREQAAKLYTQDGSISLNALRRALQSRPPNRPMELITLSACHTALGDEQSELGFVGMALQAGARSAIGTLWDVDDVATAAFFVQFYRYLTAGLEKDRALQATARAFRTGLVRLTADGLIGPRVSTNGEALLLRVDSLEERRRLAEGLRHPHYWAGMVLTGSPW